MVQLPYPDMCDTRCQRQTPNNCNCSYPKDTPDINVGRRSNMSLRDCRVSKPLGGCINEEIFAQAISPPDPDGPIQYLNPEVYQDKYAPNFYAVKQQSTGDTLYTALDPRLQLNTRGGLIAGLDRPPVQGTFPLKDVYNESLRGYGQDYKGYDDIRAGDIQYWVDDSFESPTFTPVFTQSAEVTGSVYVDPMGGIKPQYYRKPVVMSNPLTTRGDQMNFAPNLSFLTDSTEHREDIMIKQQIPMNQSDYTYRYWFRNHSPHH